MSSHPTATSQDLQIPSSADALLICDQIVYIISHHFLIIAFFLHPHSREAFSSITIRASFLFIYLLGWGGYLLVNGTHYGPCIVKQYNHRK